MQNERTKQKTTFYIQVNPTVNSLKPISWLLNRNFVSQKEGEWYIHSSAEDAKNEQKYLTKNALFSKVRLWDSFLI